MILQALKQYYDRKVSDPESTIAPFGFEWKDIAYIIALSNDGKPVSITPTAESEGNKRRAKQFLVPRGVKKTSGVKSNLLWENVEYALGVPVKGKPDRVKEQHAAFIARAESLSATEDEGVKSLLTFLRAKNKKPLLKKYSTWDDLLKSGRNVSFSLAGEEGLILERPAVRKAIESAIVESSGGCEKGFCLVTGEHDSIERLHMPIKGIRGAQTTGANIVSFNLDAFTSHGKDQGLNAPVSRRSAFAYTTGLNHLLRRDSRQRMPVGDATAVFWADKPVNLELNIVDIFGQPSKDEPDRGVNAVRNLYRSVETGAYAGDEEQTKFYVLGLSPNAARIAVRFWIVDTVAGMAGKIIQHFEDLKIVHSPGARDHLPLFQLLLSTAALRKAENINPHLAGDTMRAILDGLPYPKTLLQSVTQRIRAEQEVTYARASLIKACINRETRYTNSQLQEELKVSLDTSNTNIGYRLGRLFATLEKIQTETHPGINATIRDRFYGAASGTPVTVFSNLMRLKNHHLAKLDNKARRVYFEKLISEIMDAVNDFPGHLPLTDQGRFAVGYYHQTQQFYTKKVSNADNSAAIAEGDTNHE